MIYFNKDNLNLEFDCKRYIVAKFRLNDIFNWYGTINRQFNFTSYHDLYDMHCMLIGEHEYGHVLLALASSYEEMKMHIDLNMLNPIEECMINESAKTF